MKQVDKWVPSRKVLAGGLSSLAAFTVVMGMAHFGVPVAPDLALGLVAFVGTVVSYWVPESAREKYERFDQMLRQFVEDNEPDPAEAYR